MKLNKLTPNDAGWQWLRLVPGGENTVVVTQLPPCDTELRQDRNRSEHSPKDELNDDDPTLSGLDGVRAPGILFSASRQWKGRNALRGQSWRTRHESRHRRTTAAN